MTKIIASLVLGVLLTSSAGLASREERNEKASNTSVATSVAPVFMGAFAFTLEQVMLRMASMLGYHPSERNFRIGYLGACIATEVGAQLAIQHCRGRVLPTKIAWTLAQSALGYMSAKYAQDHL